MNSAPVIAPKECMPELAFDLSIDVIDQPPAWLQAAVRAFQIGDAHGAGCAVDDDQMHRPCGKPLLCCGRHSLSSIHPKQYL